MDLTVLDKSVYEILEGVYDEWVCTKPAKEDNNEDNKKQGDID